MVQKNKLKKSISTLLIIATLMCLSVYSFALSAQAAAPVSPQWTSILSMELHLTFDGDEGTVTGIASKQSVATNIEGTVKLYKLVGDDWIYIDEWYNSKSRGTLAVASEFPAKSGVTYKAEFTVTAYIGTVPETYTIENIKTCP